MLRSELLNIVSNMKFPISENSKSCEPRYSNIGHEAVSYLLYAAAMQDLKNHCTFGNIDLSRVGMVPVGRCRHCGTELLANIKSKTEIEVVNYTDDCIVHSLNWEFELNVPSGKLIVANDLRCAFNESSNSVDLLTDLYLYTDHYAKQGLFHPYVGNSCPSLFLVGNEIHLTNCYDDDYYNHETETIDYSLHRFGEPELNITTDLWWVSIADYDQLLKTAATNFKLGELADYLRTNEYYIIDVEPGTYLCSTKDIRAVHDDEFDPDTMTYASLTKLR